MGFRVSLNYYFYLLTESRYANTAYRVDFIGGEKKKDHAKKVHTLSLAGIRSQIDIWHLGIELVVSTKNEQGFFPYLTPS